MASRPGLLRRIADVAVASDPGLGRLQLGLAGAGNVAVCMVVGYGLALLLHAGAQGTVVFMLLSSVVAMIGTNALVDHRIRANAITAAHFPLAMGAGITAGTLLAPNHVASLVGFVVVMFLAVWMRRFGLGYFFYGFMLWNGYFFASFLKTTLPALPAMFVAIIVATAVVLLLSCTVFRRHPHRTLAAVFRSMSARQRGLARACIALLESDPGSPGAERASLAIFRARAQVTEAALMSDGWAAHAPALPEGWTASALRARLLELQLGLDRLTIGTRQLAAAGAAPALRSAAVEALSALATANPARARAAAAALPELASAAAPKVQAAAADLHRGLSIVTSVPNRPALSRAVQENEPEFVPATGLVLGQLPGIPSVASDVDPRGTTWNPLARLQFATRQAVQVAVAGTLAILVGSLISGQRYYWAVIAAFVSFAGTGTRFDTTRKSLLRVLGTLGGLVAGVIIAHLTNGNLFAALAVIVASIFCGNYLMRVSYAYMIFFLTIMLSELYAILGQFSDELLLLRLEETAAGAAVGIAVALLVTPVSTRDTIKVVQGSVLTAVADLLGTLHDRALDPASVSADTVDERVIAADNQLRRLILVGEPLTRYQIWENRPRAIRRRLTLIASIVATARSLSDAACRVRDADGELAAEIEKVADLARAAAGVDRVGASVPDAPVLAREPLDPSARAITQNLPTRAHAALDRLQALLREIA
ncbi:uncharacterized membrane protein YgaE (UPF0421/DUF939 family) [Sinomonas atrocyanea]|uniref:FUSC family protein n=1 Tax=Sinomonas atrocyanea TaxID=37927 RepID=UPI00278AECFD|nr:FUSC family protein [Sinomonas atrocyanea]MDP9885889.1 uncharacterized membrane protein YgaE (UPF0421/DUF939 family) [Sinomonas atrocyanea]